MSPFDKYVMKNPITAPCSLFAKTDTDMSEEELRQALRFLMREYIKEASPPKKKTEEAA